jgi:hypothetical protein
VTYNNDDDFVAVESDAEDSEDEDSEDEGEAGGEIGKVIMILRLKIKFVWPNSPC